MATISWPKPASEAHATAFAAWPAGPAGSIMPIFLRNAVATDKQKEYGYATPPTTSSAGLVHATLCICSVSDMRDGRGIRRRGR